MRTARVLLMALGGLMLSLLLPVASAQATYLDPTCTIDAPSAVEAGETFTVTITADPAADLSVTFLEETQSEGDATLLEATFTAPAVSSTTNETLSASCGDVVRSADLEIFPAGGSAGGGDGDENGAGAGSGSGDGNLAGILPGTGGASLWLLLLGGLRVVAGGALVVRRRA